MNKVGGRTVEDVRQHIDQALEEIKGAIDRGDISAEEVERMFLKMLE